MASSRKRSAGGSDGGAEICVGDLFIDAQPPKHVWRVERARNDSIGLVRTDKPTVFRFIASADLRNPLRYVRQTPITRRKETKSG